jgi:large conductance mechanosensitive channel
MIKEFKAFVMRGNVIDLAVAFIMGGAFAAIISSLVKDIIMPLVGVALGGVDFSNLFITLKGGPFASLADAQKAGAATINYGVFINTIITFLIVAFAMFMLIKAMNATRKPAPAAAPTTKDCPYCLSTVPLKATRCPNCTSALKS